MNEVLVIGGVSYNTMIYLDAFPHPRTQTVYSNSFYETVGSTGAGKGLNLHKLGLGSITAGLCITSLELAYPDLSPDRVERDYRKHYPRE